MARGQCDEIWTFVQKKRRQVRPGDPADVGDQYVYVGMDATGKLIISYRVGKRNLEVTQAFADDLRARVLTSDMRHTGLSLATLLGHVVTVRPRKRWCYAGHPHLSGAMEVARIDAAALGLVPLMVRWLERVGSRPEPE